MKNRKLTAAEKAEKKRRKMMFETVFVNGKQKRIRKCPSDDLINDPIFLKENEMWPELHEWEMRQDKID